MNSSFLLYFIFAIIAFAAAAPVRELKKSTELAANEIKFSKPSLNTGPSPPSTFKKRDVHFAAYEAEISNSKPRYRHKFRN
uniref:Uncharacterized protein n=1 Tax=Panagrolaimus sp. ES5 TaxID=591445 RepID=A0AC34FL26_9BILA